MLNILTYCRSNICLSTEYKSDDSRPLIEGINSNNCSSGFVGSVLYQYSLRMTSCASLFVLFEKEA